MQNAGPFTLALNTAQNLQPPNANTNRVVLINISPYVVAVTIGGPQAWLPAYTADIYQVPSGAQVAVEPVLVLSGASADRALLVSWLQPGDQAPGTFPQSLTAQALEASISGAITSNTGQTRTTYIGNIAAGTGDTQNTINTAVTDNSLFFEFGILAGGATVTNVQIVGGITGTTYYNDSPAVVPPGLGSTGVTTYEMACLISGTADTAVNVVINYTAGTVGTFGGNVMTTSAPLARIAAIPVDIPVDAASNFASSVALVPAPPAGFVYEVSPITWNTSAVTGGSRMNINGTTSGKSYGTAFCPSAVVAAGQITFAKLYVNEGLTASVGAGTAGFVNFSGSYRAIPNIAVNGNGN